MTPVHPSEVAVEGLAGQLTNFWDWATATADRRMIVLWIGWTSLSWILYIVSVYVGLHFAATSVLGLMQHSTVLALAAFAALVKPQTARSMAGPILLYMLSSVFTILIGVIQFAVSGSLSSLSLSNTLAYHVAAFGSWVWFGVVLYLVAQFSSICVTRQPYVTYEVLTLKKLLVATSLAAAGFAMQQFGRQEQMWVMPDEVRIVFLLWTTLGVAIWFVVLWAQICSYRAAFFLIVLTAIGGVCMSELMHVAVWSRMEFKEANVTLSHPALWETMLSWLTSMLGVWIAIGIARLGGYQVRHMSAPSAANNGPTI